jgi:tRNA pseudouridine38-40 synthase
MKNIVLVIAYDGSHFLGWQKNPYGNSIEKTLQDVLEKIFQEPISLQAASRTDAKVHAKSQVVNFFLKQDFSDLSLLQNKLNKMLPKEICVLAVEEKPISFHPSLDALAKEYHYFLSTAPILSPWNAPYVWHHKKPLDIEKMVRASHHLLGTHNFSAFTNDEPLDPYRTLYRINIIPMENQLLRIEIEGTSFLYNMVRIIVGTLANIGSEKISENTIIDILKSKKRKNSGETAPPHGLFLIKLVYPSFTFDKRYVNPLL